MKFHWVDLASLDNKGIRCLVIRSISIHPVVQGYNNFVVPSLAWHTMKTFSIKTIRSQYGVKINQLWNKATLQCSILGCDEWEEWVIFYSLIKKKQHTNVLIKCGMKSTQRFKLLSFWCSCCIYIFNCLGITTDSDCQCQGHTTITLICNLIEPMCLNTSVALKFPCWLSRKFC